MPRVGRNQYSDKSRLAVKAVNPESAKNFKHNTAKTTKPTRKEHALINNFTGEKIYFDTNTLIRLAHGYINWLSERKTPTLFSKFWKTKGFTLKDIFNLCRDEPEFARLIDYSRMFLAETWADPLLGEKELIGDRETIRKRASIYVQEWGDHDKNMIEFTERVRQALDKDTGQAKINAAKDIAEQFYIIGERERENARLAAEEIRLEQPSSKSNGDSIGSSGLLAGDKQESSNNES